VECRKKRGAWLGNAWHGDELEKKNIVVCGVYWRVAYPWEGYMEDFPSLPVSLFTGFAHHRCAQGTV
jgi:hypothetical protein